MTLYYDLDISLSEIASEVKTSRQAVYDAIKVSENLMKSFEEKLGLVRRYLENRALLLKSVEKLELLSDRFNCEEINEIKSNILKVLS